MSGFPTTDIMGDVPLWRYWLRLDAEGNPVMKKKITRHNDGKIA